MNFKAVFCRGSKWQRERALIIHRLLLPALVKVAVPKAAGQKERGKEEWEQSGGMAERISLFLSAVWSHGGKKSPAHI